MQYIYRYARGTRYFLSCTRDVWHSTIVWSGCEFCNGFFRYFRKNWFPSCFLLFSMFQNSMSWCDLQFFVRLVGRDGYIYLMLVITLMLSNVFLSSYRDCKNIFCSSPPYFTSEYGDFILNLITLRLCFPSFWGNKFYVNIYIFDFTMIVGLFTILSYHFFTSMSIPMITRVF